VLYKLDRLLDACLVLGQTQVDLPTVDIGLYNANAQLRAIAHNPFCIATDDTHTPLIKDVVVVLEVTQVQEAFDHKVVQRNEDAELSNTCNIPHVIRAKMFMRKDCLRKLCGCSLGLY
jgi:hypothetical protein